MSLTLRELQAAFAAHIVADDRPELIAAVAGDSIPAAARLRVYRHHVFHSLGVALAATFPTVQAVVGEAFFAAMARGFVVATLPVQPVLAEYGAEFPAFIDAHAPARGLPYLGDVARLDWALNIAFHTSLAGRLGAADLAGIAVEQLPSMVLALAPGTVLVRSAYPIDRIWAAAQPGASGDAVDLAAGSVGLLVLRRPDDAGFVALGEGEAAFVAAMAQGQTLEVAAGAAFGADASFDMAGAFARLLGIGALAAMQQ
ncbi:MAG: DNA-binding domain-containing protein [Alphaproteobacteria bacterium]|nr:DNA-binding domain-containing protein [Alphaproteobacteria bacterium]